MGLILQKKNSGNKGKGAAALPCGDPKDGNLLPPLLPTNKSRI